MWKNERGQDVVGQTVITWSSVCPGTAAHFQTQIRQGMYHAVHASALAWQQVLPCKARNIAAKCATAGAYDTHHSSVLRM